MEKILKTNKIENIESNIISFEKIEMIKTRIHELEPTMNNFYNYFHKNPEIGGEEKKTAEKISNYLSDIGVEILGDKIGGEGIVALIKGNIVDGPTIALR